MLLPQKISALVPALICVAQIQHAVLNAPLLALDSYSEEDKQS